MKPIPLPIPHVTMKLHQIVCILHKRSIKQNLLHNEYRLQGITSILGTYYTNYKRNKMTSPLAILIIFHDEITPSSLYLTQEVHEKEPPSTMKTDYKA
jgi:hypothetical protein